ncbi:hypothetical protein HLY00_5226 [Mycolicibacterium hippocampi]|uniref:Uncharacterized protein n=1 Tax=Mycolicibacterium hippocampi TaxID=659824 RepID=A0A850PZD3_9MYCO|nr:hypothetical protein [Mycolicibacterium hippocampi]
MRSRGRAPSGCRGVHPAWCTPESPTPPEPHCTARPPQRAPASAPGSGPGPQARPRRTVARTRSRGR